MSTGLRAELETQFDEVSYVDVLDSNDQVRLFLEFFAFLYMNIIIISLILHFKLLLVQGALMPAGTPWSG